MKPLGRICLLAILLAGAVSAGESAEEGAPDLPATTPATAEVPVLQCEDLASMESQVGNEVVIKGVVQSVGTGPNDGITFLNFGDRRSGFVALIFRQVYDKFPEGFDQYGQQRVRVRGTLEKYRDRQMQIKILTADQIEVVATPEP